MVRRALLPSVPGSVPRAAHFAEAAARDAGFDEATRDRMVLAATEAAANAVTHGNRLDPIRHVVLEWRGGKEGGWLFVEDEGEGLAEQRLTRAALPEDPLDTGGRGLYILKSLADEIRLERGGRRIGLRFTPRAVLG